MREASRKARAAGKSIGFVPTMGYLHEGHLSLVRKAREECDIVVVSIFVNPTQFAIGEDIDMYPRDLDRDKEMLEEIKIDHLFVPDEGEMYKRDCSTYVEERGILTEVLCGKSRPRHFRGVTTVVAKLFNIIDPNIAYFGQKDAQQAAVIKRMTTDLDFPVDIKIMPIVREDDGLAMSSRNAYLSDDERCQATGIFRSLEKAKKMIDDRETSVEIIKGEMKKVLEKGKDIDVEYIEFVNSDTFMPVQSVKDNTLIAVAAHVGRTRLIDNIIAKGAE